jgi:hypothetical protein
MDIRRLRPCGVTNSMRSVVLLVFLVYFKVVPGGIG